VVSKHRRFKLDELRQRFRLTATEKRVAAFVALAFALGLVTKCYRGAHPSPTPVQARSTTVTSMSRSTSKKAHKLQAVKPSDAAKLMHKSEEKLDLLDSAAKQDFRQK
jgi:hypothetical protein